MSSALYAGSAWVTFQTAIPFIVVKKVYEIQSTVHGTEMAAELEGDRPGSEIHWEARNCRHALAQSRIVIDERRSK